jgi:heme/copper-type cytochrome/quinol oxidase subunit 2
LLWTVVPVGILVIIAVVVFLRQGTGDALPTVGTALREGVAILIVVSLVALAFAWGLLKPYGRGAEVNPNYPPGANWFTIPPRPARR